MIVFVFGLFNSCSMNLNYEWNSLLKKSFFHSFKTCKKQIWFFCYQKPFVLFNSCCINLNYKWNSLFKKIFFILLKHIKNRSDFSVIKNHFLVLKKIDLIFFKSKDFISCDKHRPAFFLAVKTSIDSICRASLNLDTQLSVEQLLSFNELALLHLFLGQICMASILDLNSCSLKY